MSYKWMPHLRLALPVDQFRHLPRHPSYKYELIDGETWISPRPRYYHARLSLDQYSPTLPASISTRPIRPSDWQALVPIFASAFLRQEPFASAGDDGRIEAAEYSLEQTRTGGDGPLIEPACRVTMDDKGSLVGAVLVTLVPDNDPEGWDAFLWKDQPGEAAVSRREGWPHLTWIFVAHHSAGHGVGTALLAAAVLELQILGFRDLLSTFLAGNESSTLWHWRQGFRLLGYPGSLRRVRAGIEAKP